MIGGWEELEQKVLCVIKKNVDLQAKNDDLLLCNMALKDKLEHLELLLLKDSDSIRALEEEKKVMKHSIESILTSINSIEGA